ncbi:MAG: peptidylprolyl isomerase [Verrucomicrobia bacterium]|nr:peptidylprolyl isomerase [Verrucomicrobiota bacterium]
MRRLLVTFAASLFAGLLPAAELPPGLYATFHTPKGEIVCELHYKETPLTVVNFVGLAEGTLPAKKNARGPRFFDGLSFNRVVPNFVIQGGDPLNDPTGENDGGPGWEFDDELVPSLRHARGALSMANDGPLTNGSQFFITHRDVFRLDYLHSVFGRVVRGMEVVDKIAQGDKIERVEIQRVGDAAKKFEATPIAFAIYEKRAALISSPQLPAPWSRYLQPVKAPKEEDLKTGKAEKSKGFYLTDGTGTLPDFRVRNFNHKLHNYERFRRIRVVVRIFGSEKSDAVALDKLAAEVGAGEHRGALAAYFAAEDKWRLWIGREQLPALNGGQPIENVEAFIKNELHARKQRFLEPAQALTKEKKLKEAVDAMIDGLLMAFDGR